MQCEMCQWLKERMEASDRAQLLAAHQHKGERVEELNEYRTTLWRAKADHDRRFHTEALQLMQDNAW